MEMYLVLDFAPQKNVLFCPSLQSFQILLNGIEHFEKIMNDIARQSFLGNKTRNILSRNGIERLMRTYYNLVLFLIKIV